MIAPGTSRLEEKEVGRGGSPLFGEMVGGRFAALSEAGEGNLSAVHEGFSPLSSPINRFK